jgi:hypothetical protein
VEVPTSSDTVEGGTGYPCIEETAQCCCNSQECTDSSLCTVDCLLVSRSGLNANVHECPCFMFRSRRSTLVRRLWKSKVTPAVNDETAGQVETSHDLEVKSVTQSMLKRLKERQLDVLIQSVESKGGETTECVLLPKGDVRLGRRTVAPHVLCCQIWRWPDLQSEAQLKRLPCCTTADDPTSACCNPFHWSRAIVPGILLLTYTGYISLYNHVYVGIGN